jgi:hypothetical protein
MAHMKNPAYQFWMALTLTAFALGMANCAGDSGAQDSHLTESSVHQANPTPSPIPPLEHLAALMTLNREAAAHVAAVGLVPVEDRFAAAQAAASQMAGLLVSLPPAEPFTPRQRTILQAWRGALSDYANGRSGSLSRIRTTSYANATLYREITRLLLTGSTGPTPP